MIPARFVWAAAGYHLTRGVAFMAEAGWRVRAHVLVIGPIGIALIWRERAAAPEQETTP